jgi:ABC-2 type transport system ATP-binding protein
MEGGCLLEEKIIKISNLSKVFDKKKEPALQSISVQISSGKIIGLIGPDGAGKTTLIRLMVGLLLPSSGTIQILGFDTVKEVEKIYPHISYMPQRFGLYEDLTVEQNLNLYAELYGLEKEERRTTFETLLHFTNLKSFTSRLAKKLSGGMKQKLGLACTLLRKPQILFLDEPSVGVDPISRRELWEMVTQLKKENITILWSTSYLDEAERCQEVIVLNKGRVLYEGSPQNLTEKMKSRTFQIQKIATDRRRVLRKLLPEKEVIDGVIQGSSVRIVLKNGVNNIDVSKFDAGSEAQIVQVAPRFEDAFIDLIGSCPKEPSFFIRYMPEIKKDGSIAVEVKNLIKKFGNFTAVDNISFSVNRGEIFGLLGPNGAGKSTTFKMLCGLITPTDGEAFISGVSVKKVKSQARSRIGYMAQKFSLYEDMTVLQNLNFFSGIYPIPKSERREIVNRMVEFFYLAPYQNVKSKELPLGFKQRLALSCSTMHHPEILFLDEPTSGVDPITRREFWNHINGMVEKGMAIVITTHFMDEAEYCDRIALINQGRIIKMGTPDELKTSVTSKELPNPSLEDAFIFLSSKNISMADEGSRHDSK